MKKILVIGLLMVMVVALTGCTAGPNPVVNAPDEEGHIAGFWSGLWHGIIAPITFIVSLFNHNVGVYEIHNNGGWYNFGFLLGFSIIWGSGSGGAARARRRRSRSDADRRARSRDEAAQSDRPSTSEGV